MPRHRSLPLIHLLYPSSCLLCHRQLLDPDNVQLCRVCGESLSIIRPPFCSRCGEPFSQPLVGRERPETYRCTTCRGFRPFVLARSLAVYEGQFQEIIHLYKYRQRPELATYLSWMMFQYLLAQPLLWPSEILVPIPLHRHRRQERGYDQSKLLAKRLASLMDRPFLEALRRRRHTPPQTTLSRSVRTRSLRGAFEVTADICDRRLLLIDDVYTTGSTVTEGARALVRAGAKEVFVFTAARAMQ